MSIKTTMGNLVPVGAGLLASMSTAKPLPTIPVGARVARLSVEGNPVRWRDDGVLPTGTVGMPVLAGTEFLYDGDLGAIQVIQVLAGAKVSISYYA